MSDEIKRPVVPVPITHVVQVEEQIRQRVAEKRTSVAERFPLTFALAATFGLVSTFYGFEKLIDKVPLFVNNPWILLATGLATLLASGAALRKLN